MGRLFDLPPAWQPLLRGGLFVSFCGAQYPCAHGFTLLLERHSIDWQRQLRSNGNAVNKSNARGDSGLASITVVLRRLLEMHGVDPAVIGRKAGVDFARIPGPAERLPSDKVDEILLYALPLIENPA